MLNVLIIPESEAGQLVSLTEPSTASRHGCTISQTFRDANDAGIVRRRFMGRWYSEECT